MVAFEPEPKESFARLSQAKKFFTIILYYIELNLTNLTINGVQTYFEAIRTCSTRTAIRSSLKSFFTSSYLAMICRPMAVHGIALLHFQFPKHVNSAYAFAHAITCGLAIIPRISLYTLPKIGLYVYSFRTARVLLFSYSQTQKMIRQ